VALGDPAGLRGDSDLKDGLRDIDSD